MERKPSRTRAEALLRPKGGQPINLSKDRAANIESPDGETVIEVQCDTYKGRLRARVAMPEGWRIKHVKKEKE